MQGRTVPRKVLVGSRAWMERLLLRSRALASGRENVIRDSTCSQDTKQ
jgi:hypothetical protein